MPSERIQRQIDQHLDAAEQAGLGLNWNLAREHAQAALALDPQNEDALAFLAVAGRALAGTATTLAQDARPEASPGTPTPEPTPALPTPFAEEALDLIAAAGEGGKKRVYLAHDSRLDRGVALALIKTDGLDDHGLACITREAQAMGRLGDHPHMVSRSDA